MRVELLTPDAPPERPAQPEDSGAFGEALDGLGGILGDAQTAEDAFANDSGSLQNAVYERARADVALSFATSAAQHAAQAIQSILNMQV